MIFNSRFKFLIFFCLFLISFLSFFTFTNVFAFSNSNIGNLTVSLLDKYSPNQNIAGWINFSLNNENFNSLVSVSFFPISNVTNITILELIKKNNHKNYSCSTINCDWTYGTVGESQNLINFSLNKDQTKLIGFKIQSDTPLLDIYNFSFKLNSNSPNSCTNPLLLSIFPDSENSLVWTSGKSSGNFDCGYETRYGSFESSYAETIPATISSSNFCNRINLSEFPDLTIGANFTGIGNANFTFSILGISSAFEKTCSVKITSGGEFGCNINASNTAAEEYYVCLKKNTGSEYKINFEKHSASGYWEIEGEENKYDWQIFVLPASYAALDEINFSSATISGFVQETYSYLQGNYGENVNCSSGCILPFEFLSKINSQQMNLSEGVLKYPRGPSIITETNFYNLLAIPSKITMPFSKLYLNNSDLRVPGLSGIYNLSLTLDNNLIFKKQIEVLSVPTIQGVYPLEAPAAINTLFTVYASGNATRYIWNFGDNTSLETSVNFVMHKYTNLTNYILSLTLINVNGQTNANFSISVVSPKEYLNSTIPTYKKRVTDLKSQIAGFPEIVKTYLDSKFNLAGWELKLSELQVSYNSAGNDFQKYIDIANSLSELSIPNSINVTERISGVFLFNKDIVNPENIAALTSENISVSGEMIKNATFAWFVESFTVLATQEVYSSIEFNSTIPLATFVTFTMAPKKTISEIYLIINKPLSSIKLSSASGLMDLTTAVALLLDFSGGQKSFELLFLEKLSFLDLPVYLTPRLSELSIIGGYGECNFNSFCESGENSVNCGSDCKPWGRAWLWILVVLFIVFCFYILAQEWYKYRYENFLFKDKNDLYNLTNFIDNAEKQKLSKDDIFNKLFEKAWSNEQLVYAYKKYHGLRTGMFEIPIFRFFERNKMKKEIELRAKIGINPNLAPKPIRPILMSQNMNTSNTIQKNTVPFNPAFKANNPSRPSNFQNNFSAKNNVQKSNISLDGKDKTNLKKP